MTADQPQPGPPPGGPEHHYRPCRRCPRCTTGTGRPPTAEQDCWDAFLTGTVAAMAERRRRERRHEEAQAALDPSPGTAAGRNSPSAEVGSGPRW
ncbi:hypothetical protein [Kitasatospora cineracea]|uniref:Uncharacterized protein n=1 Tax=Kitasatospora cineracea TaxID=88074 RepID=A0A3N4SFY7_9ACTN|nr:hypothetical protein [Kitasatospora cineracea]ROR45042.1 hypothetical protein EDD39_3253 [Kitasatospora cineracea]RPE35404.1 hypothetical protein EDD38_3753 [Kitasatospora cineracea]